ncbi:MAG: hypothetical protein P4L83_04265 [Nevskia sp.]|nr:hypothetical protein [Nevskia sp.]
MKKLMFAAGALLCASPAFAAGTTHHPLLAALQAAHTSSTKATLPALPAISGGFAITTPGFGTAADPTLKPITLPGLGTISATYANTGKGGTMTLDVTFATAAASTNSVTLPALPSTTSSTTTPLSVQFSLDSPGTGLGSSLSQSSTLKGGGQISTTYDNGGKTGSSTLQMLYVNPNL